MISDKNVQLLFKDFFLNDFGFFDQCDAAIAAKLPVVGSILMNLCEPWQRYWKNLGVPRDFFEPSSIEDVQRILEQFVLCPTAAVLFSVKTFLSYQERKKIMNKVLWTQYDFISINQWKLSNDWLNFNWKLVLYFIDIF